MATIDPSALQFLRDLKRNNNKEWFEKNKPRFIAAQDNVRAFVDALITRMNKHDRIATESGKESLMRIYRDLRFAKDKAPYHTRFGGGISRVKPDLRGGYYLHIEPGASHIACGFFGPEPADLKRIRVDIAQDHKTWERLLNGKGLKNTFGTLQGDQLTNAPKGFPKDHAADGLLRRKQFLLERSFTDKEIMNKNFLAEVDASFKSVRPWFDHMSEVLTTDENGVSILRRR